MDNVIAAIKELLEEQSLSKAVRTRLEDIVTILEGPGDAKLKASKALSELEELSDNSSLQGYVRAQLWNISSLLEVK